MLTEIAPDPGSLPSDGDFEASASGTFSLRPGPGSTFVLDKDTSVTGAGKFEISDITAGGGTVQVDAGANFAPGVLGHFGATRLELDANATVGKLELHAIRGDGGRFGSGELHATGDSLLLGTRLGGGKTVFDGPLLIQSGDQTAVVGGAVLRTTGTTTWIVGEIALTSGRGRTPGRSTRPAESSPGPGLLKNTGTITKSGAGTLFGRGSLENSGTITVNAGAFGAGPDYGTLTQTAGLTNVLSGATLDKLVVLNGGTLKGRGTVRGVTNNGGTIEPGASPGTLSVAGAFAQRAGGLLRMEIEGAGAGQYDVLSVAGAADLGGTLELLGGYTPARGRPAADRHGGDARRRLGEPSPGRPRAASRSATSAARSRCAPPPPRPAARRCADADAHRRHRRRPPPRRRRPCRSRRPRRPRLPHRDARPEAAHRGRTSSRCPRTSAASAGARSRCGCAGPRA